MNSLKTIFTAAVLIVVLYGAYLVINRTPQTASAPPEAADAGATTLTIESENASASSEAPASFATLKTGDSTSDLPAFASQGGPAATTESVASSQLPIGKVPVWASTSPAEVSEKEAVSTFPDIQATEMKTASPGESASQTAVQGQPGSAMPGKSSGSINPLASPSASVAFGAQEGAPPASVNNFQNGSTASSGSTVPSGSMASSGFPPAGLTPNGTATSPSSPSSGSSWDRPNAAASMSSNGSNDYSGSPRWDNPLPPSPTAQNGGTAPWQADAAQKKPGTPSASGEAHSAFMRQVQVLLRQNQLDQAHVMLSQRYTDPSTTPEQALELERLLDQLAGTVIYSRGHYLDRPYRVQAGDTLVDLAKQYQVPVGLLAKINGMDPKQPLPVGADLKVVRGPFEAVVDLQKRELLLLLQGTRYAGRFPIGIGPGLVEQTGVYMITDKTDTEAIATGRQDDPNRIYGSRWLGLGERLGIHGTYKPETIGQAASEGYISLMNNDIKDVYDILSVGSKVTIRR